MPENITPKDIEERLKNRAIKKADLEALALAAGIWDGVSKQTVASLKGLIKQSDNLNKVLPYLDLLPKPKPDPEDIKDLRNALDTSTRFNRTVSFTFVALMFYIMLIIFSTTDLQIFLPDSTVRLPILDVELPLIGFYVVTPFIILIFHFHLLINLKHHQDKYHQWKAVNPNPAHSYRLDPILINFLDSYPPKSILRGVLWFVIATSIFYLPLLNLVLLIWRFGDYHSFSFSSIQFIGLVLDFVLVVGIYYYVFHPEKEVSYWKRVRRPNTIISSLIWLIGAGFWWIAFCLWMQLDQPGDWNYFPISLRPNIDLTNQIHLVGEVPDGYVLHYMRDSSDEEFAKTQAFLNFGKTPILEGRDLRFANLQGVNLSNGNLRNIKGDYIDFRDARLAETDFRGARLTGAEFDKSYLPGANFGWTLLNDAYFGDATLPDANFKHARLSRVNFERAQLPRVNFRLAMLPNVNFAFAMLADANFGDATLPKANFEHSGLSGASFWGAILPEANFFGASLLNSNFFGAKMQCTYFKSASLPCTNFRDAELSGSSFENSELSGSNFDHANLTASNFSNVTLAGGNLVGAKILCSEFSNANLRGCTGIFDSLSMAYFVDGTLDFSTEPDWEILIADSIKISSGSNRDQYIEQINLANKQCRTFRISTTPFIGLSKVEWVKKIVQISCKNGFITKNVIGLRSSDRYSMVLRNMCSDCPQTLKSVIKKEFIYLKLVECDS